MAQSQSYISPEGGYYQDQDLIFFLRQISDRWLLVALCCAITVMLAFLYAFTMKPSYVASTQVSLAMPDKILMQTLSPLWMEEPDPSMADILSQIEVMKSSPMIEMFVSENDIFRDPEYNGIANVKDFYDLSFSKRLQIVNAVKRSISITPISGTSMIYLYFESSDPLKAANYANDFIETYAQAEANKIQKKYEQALERITSKIDTIQHDIKEAENEIDVIRKANNLSYLDTDERLEKINKLTDKLTDKQAALIELEAYSKSLSEKRAYDDFNFNLPDGGVEILPGLLKRLVAVENERDILSARYGRKHPEMIAINKEISSLDTQIKDQRNMAVRAVQKRREIEANEIEQIKVEIENLRDAYQADSDIRSDIANYQIQIKTAQTLLNDLNASYMRMFQNLTVAPRPVSVVTPAVPSYHSTTPSALLIVLLGGLVGLFFGVFLALILGRFNGKVNSISVLEYVAKLPVYATMPYTKIHKDSISQYAVNHPETKLTESVRSWLALYDLRDRTSKGGGHVVTLTSSYKGEGKTSAAILLASVAAQKGQKVLLIDGDMRDPMIHGFYGIGNAKGLSDYLSDRLPLDDVIYRNDSLHIDILTNKSLPNYALNLLSTDRMEGVVRRLRESYDLIIIDAPACLNYADASVLGTYCDKVFYIVSWQSAKINHVMAGLKSLMRAELYNLGLIVTKK